LYERIVIGNGFVGVRYQGGNRLGWRDVPMHRLPNLFVLLALVDCVVQNERQNQVLTQPRYRWRTL
jgi:hypothetical protein